MVRRTAGALVLSLAVGPAICSAFAVGAVGNRQATRSYLEAEYALARARATDYAPAATALNELAGRIGAECPGVAAHAPDGGRELGELEVETATVMIIGQFAPIRQQLVRAVHVLRGLRWSDGKLTALVHRGARGLAELLLTPPNLCADWGGWVASGYSTLTPASRRFLRAIPVVKAAYGEGESPADDVSHLLAPYENHADKELAAAIRRSGRTETPEQMEAIGHANESVLFALGLRRREPLLSRPLEPSTSSAAR